MLSQSACARAIRRLASAYSRIACSGGTGWCAKAAASSCVAIFRARASRFAVSDAIAASVWVYSESSVAEPLATARVEAASVSCPNWPNGALSCS